ncbi:hypothetical protein BBJ28_00002961 [Nothophytophthora sp. Chile5]|nr:hypothetical protein BBJ28_00002961 [Nothophytophthora sp. Chile5]
MVWADSPIWLAKAWDERLLCDIALSWAIALTWMGLLFMKGEMTCTRLSKKVSDQSAAYRTLDNSFVTATDLVTRLSFDTSSASAGGHSQVLGRVARDQLQLGRGDPAVPTGAAHLSGEQLYRRSRSVRSRKSILVFLCRLVGHLRSGKLTIETAFYDGQVSIAKTVYRIYYD